MIHELQSRLEFRPHEFEPGQFVQLMMLVFKGKDFFQTFRVIRHYDPSTLKFINDRILDQEVEDKLTLLVNLLNSYGQLGREFDMKFVYPEFYEKFFDSLLAQEGIFKMDTQSCEAVCSSVARIGFTCPSVEKLLIGFKDKFKEMNQKELNKNILLVSRWIAAVIHLDL